jgi:hypothetical protein
MATSSFNPQPAAQADRRSADLFEGRWALLLIVAAKDRGNTRASNDASGLSVMPVGSLLCEARLNDGDRFVVL